MLCCAMHHPPIPTQCFRITVILCDPGPGITAIAWAVSLGITLARGLICGPVLLGSHAPDGATTVILVPLTAAQCKINCMNHSQLIEPCHAPRLSQTPCLQHAKIGQVWPCIGRQQCHNSIQCHNPWGQLCPVVTWCAPPPGITVAQGAVSPLGSQWPKVL